MINFGWRKALPVAGVLAGGLLAWQISAEDAIVPVESTTEPVILTEKSIEQRKQNVENVVGKLQDLLMPPEKMADIRQRRAAAPARFDVIDGNNGRSTLVYQFRYARVENLVYALESVLADGYVESNEDKNQVIINDLTTQMAELKKIIAALDVPSAQVLIEARIVEFIVNDGQQRNLSFMYNQRDKGTTGTGEDIELDSGMGLNPSTLGSNAPNQGATMEWYPYISDSGKEDIKVAFQWLLTAQDAKLLSSPNLVISRNETGKITTGQDLPIQQFNNSNGNLTTSTKYKRVGVKLEIEPSIIDKDSVTLRIFPEVSNVAQYQRIVQNNTTYQVPVITVRSIETRLTLEDGQIVILGGLYDTREAIQQERTPFLSDMPFLGELFTSKATTQELVQLIFFLRVHILNVEDAYSNFSFDPAEVAKETNALQEIFENSSILPPPDTTVEKVKSEFWDIPVRNRELRKAQDSLNEAENAIGE